MLIPRFLFRLLAFFFFPLLFLVFYLLTAGERNGREGRLRGDLAGRRGGQTKEVRPCWHGRQGCSHRG